MNLVEEAKKFAEDTHANEIRRYTGEPYINHPKNVAELVKTTPHTEAILAASWLHDAVEAGIPLQRIAVKFGLAVALLVANVTDISRPEDGTRKIRVSKNIAHLSKALPSAKTIKLADIIDNVPSIVQYDPQFAKVYLIEKLSMLEVLSEGDPTLYRHAQQILLEGMQTLRKAV